MPPTSAIALSGLNAAQTRLQSSAHNVANLNTAGFRRQQVEQAAVATGGVSTAVGSSDHTGPALADDMVEQLQAKHAFLANLSVFRTHDRMLGSLLDAAG